MLNTLSYYHHVRIRLDIAYCGEKFHGWARQPGQRTVQGDIEDALRTIFGEHIDLTVAGRTDAGVHANGQVAHCDVHDDAWSRLSARRNLDSSTMLLKSLNAILSHRSRCAADDSATHGDKRTQVSVSYGRSFSDVVVRRITSVPLNFDARFSALWREYSYRIADGVERWNPKRCDELWLSRGLDIDAMNRAGHALLGEHDFLSFCKPRPGASTIRTLLDLHFDRDNEGIMVGHVRADAFCHSQVRTLMGTLIEVGRGARDEHWPERRLMERERNGEVVVAPPHPLTLECVGYGDPAEYGVQAERARRYRGNVERC